jgi:acyl transferase domain-containing protein
MQHASQPGAMMHARMSIDDAGAFVENHGEAVSIAAVNGPRSLTFAGDAAALAKAKAVLAARGVMTRMLQSGRAFHSEVMRPAARELFAHLQGLTPSAPKCRIISTLTATDAPLMDAGYWASQAVSPVRFMEACIALLDARHSVFVEIGSHPVLLSGLYETAESRGELASVRAAPSMSRGSERRAFCEALATVYRAGVGVDWSKRFRGSARVLDAPRYAWDHVSCSMVPDEADGAAMSEVELTAWLRQHIALSQPVSAHTATLRELGVDLPRSVRRDAGPTASGSILSAEAWAAMSRS